MSYNRNCKWFSMEYVGNPGAVPACNQKVVLETFDCTSCQENPDNQKKTNADHIRDMTDEELAKMLSRSGKYFCCDQNKCGPRSERCDYGDECEDCWLDWLRQGR